VTRLVHLNGAPGVGKSTLALRYVADRPLALCLDIDEIRCRLGGWDAQPEESGLAARELGYAMAARHLSEGHDVVVPQYAVRAEFVEGLASVAAGAGATFHEVVLRDEVENVVRRFEARAAVPELVRHHTDAVRMMGGVTGLRGLYAELEAFVATRPHAVVVETTAGQVDEAYARLLDVLSR
jgi:predicted kinase